MLASSSAPPAVPPFAGCDSTCPELPSRVLPPPPPIDSCASCITASSAWPTPNGRLARERGFRSRALFGSNRSPSPPGSGTSPLPFSRSRSRKVDRRVPLGVRRTRGLSPAWQCPRCGGPHGGLPQMDPRLDATALRSLDQRVDERDDAGCPLQPAPGVILAAHGDGRAAPARRSSCPVGSSGPHGTERDQATCHSCRRRLSPATSATAMESRPQGPAANASSATVLRRWRHGPAVARSRGPFDAYGPLGASGPVRGARKAF